MKNLFLKTHSHTPFPGHFVTGEYTNLHVRIFFCFLIFFHETTDFMRYEYLSPRLLMHQSFLTFLKNRLYQEVLCCF